MHGISRLLGVRSPIFRECRPRIEMDDRGPVAGCVRKFKEERLLRRIGRRDLPFRSAHGGACRLFQTNERRNLIPGAAFANSDNGGRLS